MTEYIRLREGAELLGVNYGTFVRWVRSGRIPSSMVIALPDHDWRGGKRHYSRIDKKALERWVRRKA